ncbi:S8 family serine peptidase [Micromonospora sp. NBC_00389]|uniref:S8 family serine peptidase n=1 Tax=Micromonospora sp. NBC_00389 TaxID=2903586 RepID=UPI002E1B5B12
MCLGSIDPPDVDPLEAAVNDLSAQTGALFVIAAGKDGCGYGVHPVGSPRTAVAALSAAAVAVADRGYIANFSSCGPGAGDSALKPEISAPGVNITVAVPAAAPPRHSCIRQNGLLAPAVNGQLQSSGLGHRSKSVERVQVSTLRRVGAR